MIARGSSSNTFSPPGSRRSMASMAEASRTTSATLLLPLDLSPPLRDQFVSPAHAVAHVGLQHFRRSTQGGGGTDKPQFVALQSGDHASAANDSQRLADLAR